MTLSGLVFVVLVYSSVIKNQDVSWWLWVVLAILHFCEVDLWRAE